MKTFTDFFSNSPLSLKVFALILITAVISNSLCLIFYFNSRLDRMKAYYEKKLEEASNTSYSHLDFSFIDASGKEHSLTTNIKLGDGWKVQDADGSDPTPLFDTRNIIDSVPLLNHTHRQCTQTHCSLNIRADDPLYPSWHICHHRRLQSLP